MFRCIFRWELLHIESFQSERKQEWIETQEGPLTNRIKCSAWIEMSVPYTRMRKSFSICKQNKESPLKCHEYQEPNEYLHR